MKNIHRSQLAWAAFALALAAGTLVAQDGDAASRKPLLLAEALKARDEGNLQVAKQKFEAILAIDPKDMGANEGLTSVNAALAEATTSKQSADAKAAAPTDGAPAAPAAVVAPAASGAPLGGGAEGASGGGVMPGGDSACWCPSKWPHPAHARSSPSTPAT